MTTDRLTLPCSREDRDETTWTRTRRFAAVLLVFSGATGFAQPAGGGPGEVLPLARCVEIALEKSRLRPASQFAVAMAEAQHRQVISGYWPQVKGTGGYQRFDEPLNFLFPASAIPVPGQTITTPAGALMVTIPANAFGPGFPPQNVQMPIAVPAQTISTAGQSFAVPEQNVRAMDKNLASSAMDMKWLLYDGGMRKGLREQTEGQMGMMRQEARRTDLEIIDSVKRMYWGAVLARQLHQLGRETLTRMEVTLRLTAEMYKDGAGKVTKADYLDNQVMVESVRSMVASLEKNEKMAQAALANTMGLAWDVSVRPASTEIPFAAQGGDLTAMVGESYRFNPDWGKLEEALRAAEGALKTARSGYQPKVALTGEIHRWWSTGGNTGLSTTQNRTGWTVGVGVEVPIFNGFLTQNKINEARAQLKQLKEKQFLLHEGLGLQIKDIMLGLEAAMKSDAATEKAMTAAQENRDLNTRAYENGLVETEKVIRAQLMESLMTAQHFMARYQYTALLSRLNVVVGKEIQGLQPGKP